MNEYSLMREMNGSSNVVNCDDFRCVQHEDGIGWDIFIKMELLTPLTKALGTEVSEEKVIRIGRDLCCALMLCQKHDIIHRDIKPQNIFVSPNGDYKLGDFGIAKTMERTCGGTKIGTYKYMAPEVYNNQPYNHAVDIYSLGLVLYWLLNARRYPFAPLPPAPVSANAEEEARMRRFAGEKLPAPLHGSAALRRIVLKACEYDHRRRYGSAEEMLRELEALDGRAAVLPEPVPEAVPEPVPLPGPDVEEGTTGGTAVLFDSASDTVRLEEETEAVRPEGKTLDERRAQHQPYQGTTLSAGYNLTVGLKADGSVVAANGNGFDYGLFSVEGWNDIASVSAGGFNIVGLKTDSTVAAAGWNDYGQCHLRGWCDIAAISVGYGHIAGLKADGTVVAAGWNEYGQCAVEDWRDIVVVSVGHYHTVGLRADGNVRAAGWNSHGQCDVKDWRNIVEVSAGHYYTVGLKADGTVVAAGLNQYAQCDVGAWKDVAVITRWV